MQTTTPILTKPKLKRTWLAWRWNADFDEKIAFQRAMISIVLLWLVYAAFQYSWQLVNQANSFGGPVYDLWPASASNPTINRVANWSITIARGLVAVGVSLLAIKMGHKKATLFAMVMILCSFPFILTPMMKQAMIANRSNDETASQAAYALFIIFRLFLSVGGTAIMILQAPLIAKFFLKPKTRNAVAKCCNIPANVTGVLCSMLFFNGIVKATAAQSGQVVAGQWQLISGIFLIIVLGLFVVYLVVGMEFDIKQTKNQPTNFGDETAASATLKWMFKQPHIMMMLVAAIFALYAGIEPGSGLLANFWKSQPANSVYSWDVTTGLPTANSTVNDTMFAWQIIYCLALFTGLLFIGRWSNTKYSQAKFSGIIIIIGCAFWGISYGLGALDLREASIMTGVLLMGLIGSSCIFGTQSLTWAIPYRWKLSPQQITNYTSLSWTAMYIGYSLLDIITAYTGTVGINSHLATVADYVAAHPDIYAQLFNNQTGANAPTAAQMATYYADIRNVLLGSDWTTISAKLTNPSVYAQTTIKMILRTNSSIDVSLSNLAQQFIPQMVVLTLIPVIPGIIYLFIKRTADEVAFSFRDFKRQHMHFSNCKRWSNKWLKTNFVVAPVQATAK